MLQTLWDNSNSLWDNSKKIPDERAAGGAEVGRAMRDAGLEQAIRVAGGVASLARAIWHFPAFGVVMVAHSGRTSAGRRDADAGAPFYPAPRSLRTVRGSGVIETRNRQIDALRAAEYACCPCCLARRPTRIRCCGLPR